MSASKNKPLALIVAQLGARRHYAVPRIFEREGMLERFYTDIYAPDKASFLLQTIPECIRPQPLKRLLGRREGGTGFQPVTPSGTGFEPVTRSGTGFQPVAASLVASSETGFKPVPQTESLPSAKIASFPFFGLQYAIRRRIAPRGRALKLYLWAGSEFCRHVIKHGFGAASGVYTFNSAGLELLQAARHRGLKTISDQTIAPRKMEEQLLAAEQERWPEWRQTTSADPWLARYIDREEQEWHSSDLIICGSEFVKRAVGQCGGPLSKCMVVSTAVNSPSAAFVEKTRNGGPLRVLAVGAVGLRKGSPYVFAAARALQGKCVFRMVGPLDAPESVLAKAPANLELFGAVPRSDVAEHYSWADVFLLPSVCEGSSVACHEALAAGLPVICTHNTGSAVTDGINGYIVNAGDSQSITSRLQLLAQEDDFRQELSRNAAFSAANAGPEYARNLVRAVNRIFP